MTQIWYLFYNSIVIPLLYVMIYFAGFFNKKIRNGINDRKKLFENLIINVMGLNRSKKMLWFHSSSMGEFEQAKPIIEKLYQQNKYNIIVTFFSPSGYRNSKNYPYADLVSYLPFDVPYSANKFIRIVKPNIAIFMRYDIWPNFIWQLNKNNIPTFIVDATMRKDSRRKLPISRSFHHDLFNQVNRILAVSESDVENFKSLGVTADRLSAVGDTRFDRVYQKSAAAKTRKLLDDNVLAGKKVIVAGSSWEADENVILPAFLKLCKYDPDVILILVPHEPTIPHLEKLENYLTGKGEHIRFSYVPNNYNNERIIIVDSIGILLTLYYYAHIAYIGGSFRQGIHNVLEPAVYGIPVVFGPKNNTSREAQELKTLGCGIEIHDRFEAYKIFRKLTSDEGLRIELGDQARKYVSDNVGASERILKEITNWV